jgi:hypothetical protein
MVPVRYHAARYPKTSSRDAPPPGTAPGASTHSTKTPTITQARNRAHSAKPWGSTSLRRRKSWSAITTASSIGSRVRSPSAHQSGKPRKSTDIGQCARQELSSVEVTRAVRAVPAGGAASGSACGSRRETMVDTGPPSRDHSPPG